MSQEQNGRNIEGWNLYKYYLYRQQYMKVKALIHYLYELLESVTV